MHQYLKSIGFDEIKTIGGENKLLRDVKNTFTSRMRINNVNNLELCEYLKEFGQGMGIKLYGELDENEMFEEESYLPYFEGQTISTVAEVTLEKRKENDTFVAACEDPRVGISLIFQVQNNVDCMREIISRKSMKVFAEVALSGMALSGKILLPVKKDAQNGRNEEESSRRKELVNAARNGDPKAIESLTLSDIDIYSKVSKRLIYEDICTIVDSCFMPCGIECDLYSVMGTILAVRERENECTGEVICQMKIEVNEIEMEICVPKNSLLGEPMIGRRFKGEIWLQGQLKF